MWIQKLSPAVTLALLFSLLLTASAEPERPDARLILLDGSLHRGIRLESITADTLGFVDSAGKAHSVKMDEVVGVTFGSEILPAGRTGPTDVEVLLRGGDRIRGALVASKNDRVGIRSHLLGALEFAVEEVAELRFIDAWQTAAEKPTYDATEQESDVFVYRNLDRLPATFIRLTGTAVVVRGRIGGGKDYPIRFENLLNVRFYEEPDGEEPPKGRLAVLLLADGSRLTATALSFSGKKMQATTVRGKRIKVAVGNVLAIHQKGGRFVYLSDLKPAREKLVPWIGKAYAWDRPRYDRSFLDRPLRSGGETYLKGIGVISGTSLTWAVNGEYSTLVSRIALDDSGGEEGDVIFEILVDGKSKFRSKVQKRLADGEPPPRVPPLDIKGAKEITLRVTYVDDNVRDYANWIEPMLIR